MKIDYYIMGILWGTSRLNKDFLLVQNIDRSIIETVNNVVSPQKKVFKVTEHGHSTWRIKLIHSHPYVHWMIQHGFTGKSDKQRTIPNLNDEELLSFFKGYFIQHYTLDTCKLGGKIGHPRLRFYASEPILNALNQFLSHEICASIKKLQRHSKSTVTHILCMLNRQEIKDTVRLLELLK